MPRAAVGRTSAEMYPSDRGHPARGASAAQTRSRSSAPASKPPSSCGRPSSPEPCQTAHRRRGRMARPHRRLPDCLRDPRPGPGRPRGRRGASPRHLPTAVTPLSRREGTLATGGFHVGSGSVPGRVAAGPGPPLRSPAPLIRPERAALRTSRQRRTRRGRHCALDSGPGRRPGGRAPAFAGPSLPEPRHGRRPVMPRGRRHPDACR